MIVLFDRFSAVHDDLHLASTKSTFHVHPRRCRPYYYLKFIAFAVHLQHYLGPDASMINIVVPHALPGCMRVWHH